VRIVKTELGGVKGEAQRAKSWGEVLGEGAASPLSTSCGVWGAL